MQQEQIFFTSSKNLKNIGCVGAYVSTEYGNTWVIVNKCSKPISFNVVLRHNDGYTASFGKKCTPAHALYTTGHKYNWQLVSMTDGEPQC
ncbi:hypothetical protein [Fastidiosibacter lacustris]|uniref:hypothetical protein n=1 Tax=Fastidiosibacter lacustris TaxID=2056695 RepID=UPI000E352D60|nr:hypothetical protein [Fastidiosibacter lacustris]